MPRHTPAPLRRWQAVLILSVFAVAVTGAAAAGWWYARESTPAQGPIVLISVDGLHPDELRAYGAPASRAPAIDALAADAVVFERAYAHSPLTLPAHASILAGQLPFEHGVRDEAGFALKDEARSFAELLRNRGFDTGAAVSSFLLRPESGVAQGFSFFDAEFPAPAGRHAPVVERDGARTMEAARRWLEGRQGHRFFLFLQVDDAAAESSVASLVEALRNRGLYGQATIVVTADRAETGAGLSLDEAALHVPLLIKQPDGQGAGRRVTTPVQHIDLLPTVLDLVHAPIPSGLRGRSLRPVMDGEGGRLPDRPIYAETLAPMFRFGGAGKFSLTTPSSRLVRGSRDEFVDRAPGDAAAAAASGGAGAEELRGELDRLLEGRTVTPPADIAPAEEDQFAALGYLGVAPLFDTEPEPLEPQEEDQVMTAHHAAAVLASQKDYPGAIAQLRSIALAHPRMAVVQYQLGMLLGRVGRVGDARKAFAAAAGVEPDNPYIPIAVAGLFLRARQGEQARQPAALAVALAEHHDGRARAGAHEMAVRVALALDDFEAARAHAEAVERDDPALPMRLVVSARMLYAEGKYDEALTGFEQAAAAAKEHGRAVEDLDLHIGQALARLDRSAEAEEHLRNELRAFPRSVHAYADLVMLYHAANRDADVEKTLSELTEALPTPEGYETAARLWVSLGEPSRAAAVKADARALVRRQALALR
ncbi:MAG: sulfatase-like hydrolase/transferase [Acidobacteria bacterium]|nr:sulfatase-like hydrolase/transferase [Acidobacteriota bacterium]